MKMEDNMVIFLIEYKIILKFKYHLKYSWIG
jgi:hypothetical protein